VTTQTPDEEWADLNPDTVGASGGPLTGSRGTSTSGGPRAPRGTRAQKKLEALQKRLSTEMFTAGAMIGLGLNVTGYYICQESDNFTQAVVSLASKRPEWVEALEHIADVGPGLTCGRIVLGMGASLAVDRGRADPGKQFMKFLGVTSAYLAVKGGGRDVESGSSYVPPPGGTFVPVS
jgi:hypothetical protein